MSGSMHSDAPHEQERSSQVSYSDAGVDTAEGARAVEAIRGSVQSTYREEVVGDIGGFGGLFSAKKISQMKDPLLVSATDGVGTKLRIAQVLDQHETIGIDLVAMCVNDLVVSGAEPLFFLDYMAVGKLESDRVAQIVSGIAEGCRQSGCALIGGEMAEHPGTMAQEEYDLAGFCVGVVEREKIIDGSGICPGDVVMGLASNGFHSNGYSLVRKVLTDALSKDELLQPRDELRGSTLATECLRPTRIYVRSVLDAIHAGVSIKGFAHITGGGLTENIDRVLPADCDASIELGSWDVPRVIDLAIAAAGLSEEEALKTFNMGIGLAAICAPEDADSVRSQFESTGEKVFEIGKIVAGNKQVIYR